MDIDSMVAGRELDGLVAERVMGLPVCWDEVPIMYKGIVSPRFGPFIDPQGKLVTYNTPVERYSIDIAAAWLIVEHFDQKVSVTGPGAPVAYGEYNNDELWQAEIEGGRAYGLGKADTAPLAICRAALKMKGVS